MLEKYNSDCNYVVQRKILALNEVIPLGYSCESLISTLVNK